MSFFKDLRDIADQYGPVILIGVCLAIASQVVHLFASDTELPWSSKYWERAPFQKALAVSLCAVGIVLLFYEHDKVKRKSPPPAGGLQSPPAGVIAAALDAASAAERNEDAREKTLTVLIRQEYFLECCPESHPAKAAGVTVTDGLKVLLKFQHIGKKSNEGEVRDTIDQILSHGEEVGFRPPAIEYYLWGLKALTYLASEYNLDNARLALPGLSDAVAQLTKKQKYQYGRRTLENAKGICHGVLASDRNLAAERRLEHLIEAGKIWISHETYNESEDSRYRTCVNLAELFANVYWCWKTLGTLTEEQQKEKLARLKEVIKNTNVTTPADFFRELFDKSSIYIANALNIAKGSDRKRPHVHFTRLVVFVAFTHAMVDYLLPQATGNLLESATLEGLTKAVDQLESESPPDKIREAMTYSPIIVEGLLKTQSPQLQTMLKAMQEILTRLETQAKARV